ncbi:MAG: acyltransferase family protein, partial [Anaerolineales bacterium]|nr:acyltransferase family protein [Anaerolineales bacterium]
MIKRIGYIDIAKGIGILLVVLGHNYGIQASAPFLHRMVFSFHIPLFFFLSGFVFHLPPSFMELLKRKFHSLMFPFLFTTFLIYFANTFFSRMDLLVAFKRMIKASFYAGGWYLEWIHLWFLPHLFVVSIFAYVIISFIRNPYIRWMILAGGFAINQSALPYFWPLQLTVAGVSYKFTGLPFSLDLVVICAFFFLLGNEVEQLDYQKWIQNRFLLLVSFLALLALNLLTDARLDLFLRTFDSLWINTAEAILGIIFILALSFQIEALIPGLAAVLTYFGRISLYILIFHWYIQEALRVKLLKLTGNIPISGWGAFIASGLVSI